MYDENDFIQLSALQHYLFCRRQCALIHIEQVWEENFLTAQGRIMHENADDRRIEERKGIRIERGLPLKSAELGLSGKADVVEFLRKDRQWIPFPVEYKRGKPKQNDCDRIQVCAQALCLEEMMAVNIPAGALYYGKTKHRTDVEFTPELRENVKQAAISVHKFLSAGNIPIAEYSKRCKACSIFDACQPVHASKRKIVAEYFNRTFKET